MTADNKPGLSPSPRMPADQIDNRHRGLLAPTVCLVLAAGLLVWAFGFSNQQVLVDKVAEAAAPPAVVATEPAGAQNADETFSLFGDQPVPPPPPPPPPVEKTETVTIVVPEPRLVQDITAGGLVLTPDGRIKRTYSGDQPDAVCPT